MQKETKVQMHLKEIENKLSMAQYSISLGFRVMDSQEDIVGLAEEIMISAQKIKEILTDVEVESAKEERNSGKECRVTVGLTESRSAFAASEKIKAGLSENGNKHSEEQEYRTMDDSVKSFVKMEQRIKERDANLANQITHYAQEHGTSWEELMKSLLFVKQEFTSGATLRKMDEEE